jgi:hypothetical protein
MLTALPRLLALGLVGLALGGALPLLLPLVLLLRRIAGAFTLRLWLGALVLALASAATLAALDLERADALGGCRRVATSTCITGPSAAFLLGLLPAAHAVALTLGLPRALLLLLLLLPRAVAASALCCFGRRLPVALLLDATRLWLSAHALAIGALARARSRRRRGLSGLLLTRSVRATHWHVGPSAVVVARARHVGADAGAAEHDADGQALRLGERGNR